MKLTNGHTTWAMVLAEQIVTAEERGDIHPALVDRALPASLNLTPRRRLVSQPNYISDLGLRPVGDPRALLRGHRLDWFDELRVGTRNMIASGWKDRSIEDSEAAAHLDATVCFAGEWSDARSDALFITKDRREAVDFRLALYVGSVLAATTSPTTSSDEVEAVVQTLAEASALAETDADSLMTTLRLATWYTKRQLNGRGTALAILKDIRRDAETSRVGGGMSAADRDTIVAATKNLEALGANREGDIHRAHELMVEARTLSFDSRWVSIDPDAAYRYHTQIRTNLAQVLWKLDQREEAIMVLDEALDLTAGLHPASRSESAALGGYFRYLNGDLETALPLLLESIRLIAREGAPSRLAKARSIAAVVLHNQGRLEESEAILKSIVRDPTGRSEALMTNAEHADNPVT